VLADQHVNEFPMIQHSDSELADSKASYTQHAKLLLFLLI